MESRKRIEITAKDAGIVLALAENMDDDLEDYFSFLGEEKVKEMRQRWDKVKERLRDIGEHL